MRDTGRTGWHEGERAVQERVGEAARADRSLGAIGAGIPPVAAGFLAAQRIVVAGARDAGGRVWASLLAGPPGFARARDARTLEVAALPAAGDPLAAALELGDTPVGLLAIEPQTRRRMRVNGTARPGRAGLLVHTDEVYANCPKYLQRREVVAEAPEPAEPPDVARGPALDGSQRRLVACADTFFVASAHPDGAADVSHRGGNPGFVSVDGPRALSWPDYTGNAMYMTLGNLELDPRAGLLFVDWDAGTTLQLTGRAVVDFSPRRAALVPGARRVVDFTVEEVVQLTGRPLARWRLQERSRLNPPVIAAGGEPGAA